MAMASDIHSRFAADLLKALPRGSDPASWRDEYRGVDEAAGIGPWTLSRWDDPPSGATRTEPSLAIRRKR